MAAVSQFGAERGIGCRDGEATKTEDKENEIRHDAPPGSNWSAECVSYASNLDMEIGVRT